MDLCLNNRIVGPAALVTAEGELDILAAPQLREELAELIRAGSHHLIVDLNKVELIDSTGLGVLLGALKKAREHHGSVRVVCSQERITKVFRVTGLTQLLPMYDSIDPAIAAIRAEI